MAVRTVLRRANGMEQAVRNIIVLGGRGHGKVVVDIVAKQGNSNLIAILDSHY